MSRFAIRTASPEDGAVLVASIRAMVTEMARHGGHAPASDPVAWETVRAAIFEELSQGRARYLMAVGGDGTIAGLGGAELTRLGGAFAPATGLHVDVLYVDPAFRRQGVAGRLLTELLAWGKASGACACSLNVLVDNPARSLYLRHGFVPFELRMTRPLAGWPEGSATGDSGAGSA